MAYEPYSTTEYYTDVYGGSLIPGEKLLGLLRQASRHVDSLTFNRISGGDFPLLRRSSRT